MVVLFQSAVLAILTGGSGFWIWLLARRPSSRSLPWLWCGLAGFSLSLLLLQWLVYWDWPLRRTVPFVAAMAGAGFIALVVTVWRARATCNRWRWREILLVLGAGAGAGLVHSTSLVSIGSDRFVGDAQIDHVNYVTTAQFLIDEPFSTDLRTIGLRPWLWRPLELKNQRITECVAVGFVAVLTRSDAQRAWGATAVFFTILLAMALTGMWRVAGTLPDWAASLLGAAGAAIPAVTSIYLLGFFSQLSVLFIFPALIAVTRAGALPRRFAMVVAASLLAFLAAAYTEFWPIGVAVAGGSILCWPLKPLVRLAVALATTTGSLLLTGAYLPTVPEALFFRVKGVRELADSLNGWVPDGISWLGWGRNFFAGDAPWIDLLGGLVAGGALLGVLLQPAHRRWRWCAALAGPGALAAYFFLQPKMPVYAAYKLFATFAPLCVGLAALGLANAAGRLGPRPRWIMVGLLGLGGGWAVASAVAGHVKLVQKSRHGNRAALDQLWAARDRVEQARGNTYLLENAGPLVAAWLTYFARGSAVYCDLPALSDRRVPSESVAFRKIPPGVALTWLDLERQGTVPRREPSPVLSVQGARSSFEIDLRRVYILGRQTEFVLLRADGFLPVEQDYVLDCGLNPLSGIAASVVTVSDRDGPLQEINVRAATRVRIPLRAGPGRTVYTLRVRPADSTTGPHDENRDLLLLQTLGIERAAIPAISENTPR